MFKNHYAIRGKKFQQPSDFSLKEKLVFQNFFCTNFLSYALLRLTLSEKQVKRL